MYLWAYSLIEIHQCFSHASDPSLQLCIYCPNVHFSGTITLSITVDNQYTVYIDGTPVGSDDEWTNVEQYTLPDDTQIVAIYAYNEVSYLERIYILCNLLLLLWLLLLR